MAEYFGGLRGGGRTGSGSKNVELDYSNLVTQDTMIIADPEQMKRVINNIISNSVKYMDKPKGKN